MIVRCKAVNMVDAAYVKKVADRRATGCGRWVSLATCFAAPLLAFSFLATAPHAPWACLLWITPMWLTPLADFFSPKTNGHGAVGLPAWVFDLTLYLLALFQLTNIVLLLFMAPRLAWGTQTEIIASLMNLFAVKVVVGTSSSFSGIVVAHELIHRRNGGMRLLGRLLLALACYEHFSTEHLKGHHRRVGMPDDPATAPYGESLRRYWRRALPAQFKSAWRLESGRLGLPAAPAGCWLKHHVLQGVLFEALLLSAIAWVFGPVALSAFLLQAVAAVQKLEVVNYIEHWGLARRQGSESAPLAWDSDSWFTQHTLIGLPLHTDHHRNPRKPYQSLTCQPESPRLPHGYFCMVFLAVWMNRRFQALLTRELKKRCLGPFAER